MRNNYIYEFEVYYDQGRYIALPYDFDDICFGPTIESVCKQCAETIQLLADEGFFGRVPPIPTFGNEPKHENGTTLIVTASSDKPVELDWWKAQERFEDLVAITALTKNATTITRNGEPAAKLVPYEAPEEDYYEEEAEDEE